MLSIYLDECLLDDDLVRPLRSAGYSLYLTSELGAEGQTDDAQLDRATQLRAAIATQNQKHFARLHHRWHVAEREHAGILLVSQQLPISKKIEFRERAARLLTPELARNQLIPLGVFITEEQGQAFAISLHPAG